jgi:hypothetical protein
MDEICFVTLQTADECISNNDFLCIGFDMGKLNNRTLSFSVISYKTFTKTQKNIYGPGNENINHVFPLYISREHWQIVENNLDNYFTKYDKNRIPFKVLASVLKKANTLPSEYNNKLKDDIITTCNKIIDYYDMRNDIETNVNNFIENVKYRTEKYFPCLQTFLTKYVLVKNNDSYKKIALLVIDEQLRRNIKKFSTQYITDLLDIDVNLYIKNYMLNCISIKHKGNNKNLEVKDPNNFTGISNNLTNSQKKYIDCINELFNIVVKQPKLIEILIDPKKIFGKKYSLDSILTYEQIIALGINYSVNIDDKDEIFDEENANRILKKVVVDLVQNVRKLCENKINNL